jgi:hypothetical protein
MVKLAERPPLIEDVKVLAAAFARALEEVGLRVARIRDRQKRISAGTRL